MFNPARELATILEQWREIPRSKTVYQVRNGSDENDVVEGNVGLFINAGSLLAQVLQRIELMESVGDSTVGYYRGFVPRWWDAVTVPNQSWASTESVSRELFSQDLTAILHALAGYFDRASPNLQSPSADVLANSKEGVQELFDLLRGEDCPVAGFDKDYVFSLLTEVRTMLDAAESGIDFDLVRRVNELRGSLDFLMERISEENEPTGFSERVRTALRKVTPITVNTVRTAGFVLDAANNIRQLTS